MHVHCKEVKGKNISFKLIRKIRSKNSTDYVFIDLCGPIIKTCKHRYEYYLRIIDNYCCKILA